MTSTNVGSLSPTPCLDISAPRRDKVYFTSDEYIFIVYGAVCKALVADLACKTIEDRYMDDSRAISKNP